MRQGIERPASREGMAKEMPCGRTVGLGSTVCPLRRIWRYLAGPTWWGWLAEGSCGGGGKDEVAYLPPLWPLLPELEDGGIVCLRLLCYEGGIEE